MYPPPHVARVIAGTLLRFSGKAIHAGRGTRGLGLGGEAGADVEAGTLVMPLLLLPVAPGKYVLNTKP
jgi:hypothetical protein